jgi:hypothetical protein
MPSDSQTQIDAMYVRSVASRFREEYQEHGFRSPTQLSWQKKKPGR